MKKFKNKKNAIKIFWVLFLVSKFQWKIGDNALPMAQMEI